MAYKLGYEFASYGMTVVSGLAKGIDAFAHSGALKAGGKTIAVMGCGVDVIYPNENFRLYNDIKDNGLIISEQPPGAIPFAGNFPTRNRIISGLSKGVVVVEAGKKSGSLITAEFAADQGRDVFAVPGDINKNNSKGTNELIRDGAHLIGCINDIFEIIGSTKDPDYINRQNYVEKIDEYVCLSGYEQKVFEELKYEYMNIEQLFAKTKIPMDELLVSLSLLEIKGKIICNSNKKYVIL